MSNEQPDRGRYKDNNKRPNAVVMNEEEESKDLSLNTPREPPTKAPRLSSNNNDPAFPSPAGTSLSSSQLFEWIKQKSQNNKIWSSCGNLEKMLKRRYEKLDLPQTLITTIEQDTNRHGERRGNVEFDWFNVTVLFLEYLSQNSASATTDVASTLCPIWENVKKRIEEDGLMITDIHRVETAEDLDEHIPDLTAFVESTEYPIVKNGETIRQTFRKVRVANLRFKKEEGKAVPMSARARHSSTLPVIPPFSARPRCATSLACGIRSPEASFFDDEVIVKTEEDDGIEERDNEDEREERHADERETVATEDAETQFADCIASLKDNNCPEKLIEHLARRYRSGCTLEGVLSDASRIRSALVNRNLVEVQVIADCLGVRLTPVSTPVRSAQSTVSNMMAPPTVPATPKTTVTAPRDTVKRPSLIPPQVPNVSSNGQGQSASTSQSVPETSNANGSGSGHTVRSPAVTASNRPGPNKPSDRATSKVTDTVQNKDKPSTPTVVPAPKSNLNNNTPTVQKPINQKEKPKTVTSENVAPPTTRKQNTKGRDVEEHEERDDSEGDDEREESADDDSDGDGVVKSEEESDDDREENDEEDDIYVPDKLKSDYKKVVHRGRRAYRGIQAPGYTLGDKLEVVSDPSYARILIGLLEKNACKDPGLVFPGDEYGIKRELVSRELREHARTLNIVTGGLSHIVGCNPVRLPRIVGATTVNQMKKLRTKNGAKMVHPHDYWSHVLADQHFHHKKSVNAPRFEGWVDIQPGDLKPVIVSELFLDMFKAGEKAYAMLDSTAEYPCLFCSSMVSGLDHPMQKHLLIGGALPPTTETYMQNAARILMRDRHTKLHVRSAQSEDFKNYFGCGNLHAVRFFSHSWVRIMRDFVTLAIRDKKAGDVISIDELNKALDTVIQLRFANK